MRDCLLVDFDGTLTKKDTNRVLVLSLLKKRPICFWVVIYAIFKMKFSKSSNNVQFWKNWCIGKLITGMNPEDLNLALESFKKSIINIIRPELLERLLHRKKNGETILVVTASFQEAVSYTLKNQDFCVIGTQYCEKDGIFTDSIVEPMCFGEGKVQKILKWVENCGHEVHFVEAWSDSLSDMPMMKLANKRVWICNKSENQKFLDALPQGHCLNY